MQTVKLATDIADSIMYGGSSMGWSHVAEEEGDAHRWEREMTTVIRNPEGVHYAFDWRQGLTENQENQYPWQKHAYNVPDLTEIDVYEVYPGSKVVTVWLPVQR